MARRIVHQLVDDFDGTVLEVGEGETVSFSLNNTSYEIDLSAKNAAEFRTLLEPYISAARRSGGVSARSGRRRRQGSSPEIAAIRQWAKENGYEVSERGRISATVQDAYRAAQ